jgi:hypothetical protein
LIFLVEIGDEANEARRELNLIANLNCSHQFLSFFGAATLWANEQEVHGYENEAKEEELENGGAPSRRFLGGKESSWGKRHGNKRSHYEPQTPITRCLIC